MRLNETTALSNPKCLLVPYSAHHVPTYHTWMQDPSLQSATASEPLTLEEEFAMQKSWREDHDKLTFIICLPLQQEQQGEVRLEVDDRPERMVGDVNLFLFEPDDERGEGEGDGGEAGGIVGELELMIARPEVRRQGYGRAALLVFIGYILWRWEEIALEYAKVPKQLKYLRVKINESNAASIALFKSIGFQQVGKGANWFGEVELRWRDDGSFLSRLRDVPWMGGRDIEEACLPYGKGED